MNKSIEIKGIYLDVEFDYTPECEPSDPMDHPIYDEELVVHNISINGEILFDRHTGIGLDYDGLIDEVEKTIIEEIKYG